MSLSSEEQINHQETGYEAQADIAEGPIQQVAKIVDKQSKKKLFISLLAGLLSVAGIAKNAEGATGRQKEEQNSRLQNIRDERADRLERVREERKINLEIIRDDRATKNKAISVSPANLTPLVKNASAPLRPPSAPQHVEVPQPSQVERGKANELLQDTKENVRPLDQQALIKQLEEEITPDRVARILSLQSIKDPSEREKAMEAIPAIEYSNIDKIFAGVSQADVELIFKECIPKFSIKRVSFKNDPMPIPGNYGIASDRATAVAYRTVNGEDIVFVAGVRQDGVARFVSTAQHEAGHCLDPKGNVLMTLDDRLTLQKMINDRIKSSDRQSISYVEEITNPNKKIELAMKASEYFAEIIQLYIKNPQVLKQPDRAVVEFMLQKTDPTFDPAYASRISKLITTKALLTERDTNGKLKPASYYENEIKKLVVAKQAQRLTQKTNANRK